MSRIRPLLFIVFARRSEEDVLYGNDADAASHAR